MGTNKYNNNNNTNNLLPDVDDDATPITTGNSIPNNPSANTINFGSINIRTGTTPVGSTATLYHVTSNQLLGWNDGSFLTTSSSKKKRGPKINKSTVHKPSETEDNIFITNKKTGRTKVFHTTEQVVEYLYKNNLHTKLNQFIIVKEPLSTKLLQLISDTHPIITVEDLRTTLDLII